ncbi:MAG: PEP-CTERM sorting domain-containing protein [Planctomycetota bacterium]
MRTKNQHAVAVAAAGLGLLTAAGAARAAIAPPEEVVITPLPSLAFYEVTTSAFVQSIDQGFVEDFIMDPATNGLSFLPSQLSSVSSDGAFASSTVGGFAGYVGGDTILRFVGDHHAEVFTLRDATHDGGVLVDLEVQMPFVVDLEPTSTADTVRLLIAMFAEVATLGFGTVIEMDIEIFGPSPNPLDPLPELGDSVFKQSFIADDGDAEGVVDGLNGVFELDIPATDLGIYTFELTLKADTSERQGGEPVDFDAAWNVVLFVPEPASLALLTLGGALALGRPRRSIRQ